jgi:hypothetical protein
MMCLVQIVYQFYLYPYVMLALLPVYKLANFAYHRFVEISGAWLNHALFY